MSTLLHPKNWPWTITAFGTTLIVSAPAMIHSASTTEFINDPLFVVGLLLTVVIASGEHDARRVERIFREIGILRKDLAVRDTIIRAIESAPNDLVKELQRAMFEEIGLAGSALSASRYLRGDAEIYHCLNEYASRLLPGDELLAACSEKSWSKWLEKYFETNIAKSKLGVLISRVFVNPGHNANRYARAQAHAGISVFRLIGDWKNDVDPRFHLPPTWGFAVFKSETIVIHKGIGADSIGIVIENNPYVVAYFKEYFAELKRNSDSFEAPWDPDERGENSSDSEID